MSLILQKKQYIVTVTFNSNEMVSQHLDDHKIYHYF